MALVEPIVTDSEDMSLEVERSAILINNLRIQVYVNQLLNMEEERQQKGKRRSRPRRRFVRPWRAKRALQGHYHHLLPELQAHDPDTYRYYLRVDRALFCDILQRIKPRIDTNWRKALEPGLRLAITLRFMATGEAYKSLALNFRVGPNTIFLLYRNSCFLYHSTTETSLSLGMMW